MDTEFIYKQMEKCMMDIGKMIKHIDLDNILILMVHNMKDIGYIISNMEKDKRNGKMVLNIRETMLMHMKSKAE